MFSTAIARKLDVKEELVVVLAPHPDDEVLGCGQLLSKTKDLGNRAVVVFMTSGDASHADCVHKPGELSRHREQQAFRALRTIGIPEDDILFLGLPDGRLNTCLSDGSEETCRKIIEFVGASKSCLIVAPHPQDNHVDHTATAKFTNSLKSEYAKLFTATRALYYVTWSHYALSVPPVMPYIGGMCHALRDEGALLAKKKMWDAYAKIDHEFCDIPPTGTLPAKLKNRALTEREFYYELK